MKKAARKAIKRLHIRIGYVYYISRFFEPD
jgi:hypothetical protein